MRLRLRKYSIILGVVVGSAAILVLPALANILTGASGTADCNGYNVTVMASDLTPGTDYEIDLLFTLTCGGSTTSVPGMITFTATDTTATVPGSGTWPSGPLTTNCSVSGTATLTSSGSSVPITFNGSNTGSLNCGTTTGGGKTFSIGPSSMEGSLFIHPGDWVNGGYNFKFTNGNHGATMYSVTATVTVPVTCADNSIENIVVPLGAPGQLDGGGVTTFTYTIAAGDTTNHASGDQNSILVWEGAVQAPPDLCGGAGGRNQKGAIFSSTVSQNPHVGLVAWQFHYRDPAAKGKPNTDCTNANDPNRNRADVCGASWSQTVTDP